MLNFYKLYATVVQSGVRVANGQNVKEKNIHTEPNLKLYGGEYVEYDDITMLITEVEENYISHFGKGIMCNQKMRLSDTVELPIYITNDAYGSKMSINNLFTTDVDTKAKVKMAYNEHSKEIDKDFRFILNNSKHDIFRVIDITTSMEKGVITLICKKDKLIEGYDDLENNLAYNSFVNRDVVVENEIIGEEVLLINQINKYTISNAEECTFIADEYCEIVHQSNGECTLKGKKAGEVSRLMCIDSNNNILAEKNILISRR